MRLVLWILLISTFSLNAQYAIKVKREDNRFLFYKTGSKTDTILKHTNDLFYVHFPDSVQHDLMITTYNGQLIKHDSLFKFIPVHGMKYSLTKPDTAYVTLLEGTCPNSKTILMEIWNTQTNRLILRNNFIVK